MSRADDTSPALCTHYESPLKTHHSLLYPNGLELHVRTYADSDLQDWELIERKWSTVRLMAGQTDTMEVQEVFWIAQEQCASLLAA